jgi:hypothetical protein
MKNLLFTIQFEEDTEIATTLVNEASKTKTQYSFTVK